MTSPLSATNSQPLQERLGDGLQGEEEEGLRSFYIFYITKVFYISEDTQGNISNVNLQTAEICSIILNAESVKNLSGPDKR